MGRFRDQGALTLAILLSGAALVISAQSTNFKANARLVQLLVSVKDSRGQLVGTLSKPDFTVFDCGVRQEVTVFEHHTALPLSVSVLIDNSGSTGKDLRYETTSVERFLRALLSEGNTDDAASLYSFNDEVVLLSSFTRREQRLSDALRQLRSSAGTSMYDAIYLASRDLEKRGGRHVIVIVTDGGDTTSDKKYHNAIEASHRAEAVIYPILVVPVTNDAGRNLGGEHALDTLSSDTGGLVFSPSVGAQLDAAFDSILRDLRTQYLVGYYPRNLPPDAPRFRPVKVELARKDLRATTRSGYYGDSVSVP